MEETAREVVAKLKEALDGVDEEAPVAEVEEAIAKVAGPYLGKNDNNSLAGRIRLDG